MESTIDKNILEKFKSKDKGIDNKQIKVKRVAGVYIKKFRNMKEKLILLSEGITLIAGHNGTMKSTLIGLFVHPFNSYAQDIFGSPLKTQFSEIFKLSPVYDKTRYDYKILLEDENGLDIFIPIYTKPRSKDDPSIRIITGGNQKGDGNLIFNTNYLNLNRLYSIHTSNAKPVEVNITAEEKLFVSRFYNQVLLKRSYNDMETIMEKSLKKTFGPTNSFYDYESISSGEDNLGRIANSLLSFMRLAKENKTNSFNGLLCIDEIEASLHPVAQINLFNFLYKWSKKYKVQILVNSHSLPLIKHAINQQNAGKDVNTYYLSTLYSDDIQVFDNLEYESIYKELTFDYSETAVEIPKIDVICEDRLASKFVRLMVSTQQILNRVNFVHTDTGLSHTFLAKLGKKAKSLLKNTIIVFDADVPDNELEGISKNNYIKLPDKLPIEKLFIKFIYEKPKDDELFVKKLKMPRDKFIASLIESNININNSSEIKDLNTKHFKEWFKKNDRVVNKLFNYFSKNVNGRKEFVTEFIKKLNAISEKNGYPLIDYKD